MKYLQRMLSHKNDKRTLFGHPMGQSWASIWVIEQLLSQYKPDEVMELGTGGGLLSMYLWAYSKLNNANFQTHDVVIDKSTIHYDIKSEITDIYSSLSIIATTVLFNVCKRPFLIIDAGDPKSKAVNLYAPKLKSGTVIFAHDCALKGNTGDVGLWMFPEDDIDWTYVRRLEPYYSMGVELDTRMLALEVK